MNVDLHTHTYPASDCSRISYRDYIAWCVDNHVEAIALTNHGDVSDNLRLGFAVPMVLVLGIIPLASQFAIIRTRADGSSAQESSGRGTTLPRSTSR